MRKDCHYENELKKLEAFRGEAKRKKSRFAMLFLKNVSHFTDSIERARKLLAKSNYEALCRDPARWVLKKQPGWKKVKSNYWRR